MSVLEEKSDRKRMDVSDSQDEVVEGGEKQEPGRLWAEACGIKGVATAGNATTLVFASTVFAFFLDQQSTRK